MLAFEYHGTGFYGTCAECRSLGGVLARLEALGYACYWQGAHGGSRQLLLTELQRFIPPSLLLPEDRLHTLLRQALLWQTNQCLH